jgi:type IV pilus assembly protein PilX
MLVVLVFTLALTGLAVFGAKFAFLGEAVARNQLDQQVARQAAEAALRDAERDLLLSDGTKRANANCDRAGERPVMSHLTAFDNACTHGQCGYRADTLATADYAAATPAVSEFWWPASHGGLWNNNAATKPPTGKCTTFTGGVPMGTFTGVSPMAGVVQQPEYMLERIRRGESYVFRITARGFGYRSATQTVLQSYFLVPPDL